MIQMQYELNNIPLNEAIDHYGLAKQQLGDFLQEQPRDYELIKNSLWKSALFLQDIYNSSSPHWKNDNANGYNQEYDSLINMWIEFFPGLSVLDDVILIKIPILHVHDGSLVGQGHDHDPLPVHHGVQLGRILLGVFGGILFFTGIGAIGKAAWQISSALAAREVAKKATEVVVRKAAEALAKKLALQGVVMALAGGAGIFTGSLVVRRAIGNPQALLPVPQPQQPIPLVQIQVQPQPQPQPQVPAPQQQQFPGPGH